MYIYTYIIYTPNLGLGTILFDWKRKQGRFRGSSEGAKRRSKGALSKEKKVVGEQWESSEGVEGAAREQRFRFFTSEEARCNGSLIWLPPSRLQLLTLFVNSSSVFFISKQRLQLSNIIAEKGVKNAQ